MHDALVMRGGQRIGQRARNLDNLLHRQTTPADEPIKGLPLHQFHGEKVDTVSFFHGIDRDNVGMIERG